MYFYDTDLSRKWRPWHVYDGGDRFAIYALCSKVFDAKPAGASFRSEVPRDETCGICLAKVPTTPLIGAFYVSGHELWLTTFEGDDTMLWSAEFDLDRITDIATF